MEAGIFCGVICYALPLRSSCLQQFMFCAFVQLSDSSDASV